MSVPCTKEEVIAKVTESTKSAHHRIDELKERVERQEENSKILYEMNKNLGIIATQTKNQEDAINDVKKDLKDLKKVSVQSKEIEDVKEEVKDVRAEVKDAKDDINKIKEKPAKKWEALVKTIITVITTALVTALAAGVLK